MGLLLLVSCWGCSSSSVEAEEIFSQQPTEILVAMEVRDTSGLTIEQRFLVPDNFARTPVAEASFGAYLRQLPLKPPDALVHHFDGRQKRNQAAASAVINLDIGKRDLQQCADAVIRLRAEYLWQQQAYDDIQFHFTNGFLAPYRNWRAGQRIRVNGNNVSWVATGTPDPSYRAFRKYLDMIFAYAGTLSVAKELDPSTLDDIQIGDVFIQGGSPGHAVIVVDMVIQADTGEKQVLLAQSYMPAQDIHVLSRPGSLSPWYPVSEMRGDFRTPEWTFNGGDLRQF